MSHCLTISVTTLLLLKYIIIKKPKQNNIDKHIEAGCLTCKLMHEAGYDKNYLSGKRCKYLLAHTNEKQIKECLHQVKVTKTKCEETNWQQLTDCTKSLLDQRLFQKHFNRPQLYFKH